MEAVDIDGEPVYICDTCNEEEAVKRVISRRWEDSKGETPYFEVCGECLNGLAPRDGKWTAFTIESIHA